MVVQHNLGASNASRMYNITRDSLGKESEKLSSGFRINRSADGNDVTTNFVKLQTPKLSSYSNVSLHIGVDADMSEEMVKYSKNKILSQAGEAMISQSKNSTQGVINLLK